MKKEQFWKNFNLGMEVSLSGSFIYNGLKVLDDLATPYYEDVIFEFLYNISIGIERLEKVAIILIEHDSLKDQNAFEKSLITHNHLELLARIKKKYTLKLGKPHNSFLQLLGNFYKTMRYSRYILSEVRSYDKEKKAIMSYITRYLGITFDEKLLFVDPKDNLRMKRFLAKIIGKIATELYETIGVEARRQNIYTYELRTNSKAFKIFMRKEFNFWEETVLWKELLIFLINSSEQKGAIGFIKDIEPLDFDLGLVAEYLSSFKNDLHKLEHLDELEMLYETVQDKKYRFEMLEAIGNPNISFDIDDDDEDIFDP